MPVRLGHANGAAAVTRGHHGRAPRVPVTERVYAVGDIHGRADLLGTLHGQIAADAKRAPEQRRWLIFLGDYVDRGPDSRGVLDILTREPLAGFETVHLIGNHEDMLRGFLDDPAHGQMWLYNGGDATLRSYGIEPLDYPAGPVGLAEMGDRLNGVQPAEHRRFLDRLRLNHLVGDYFFVHAGVRPGVPLDRQIRDDMIWIREDFLDSAADFGKVVVHGHTPSRSVERHENRIGIDTGAFASDTLTCLVLSGAGQRVLQT